jgi:hypothetical protein
MPLALTTSFLDAERGPSAQVVAGLAADLSNHSDFALVPRVGLFTSRVGLFTSRVGLFTSRVGLFTSRVGLFTSRVPLCWRARSAQ